MPGYLDHAASTPTRPEVVDAMLPYLRDIHANPSGAHRASREVRRALDDARDTMAEALGAEPGEIVFTSGGTESDNLAVLGTHDRVGGVVVGSAIEHHAVLDPVIARNGRLVAVTAAGIVDLDDLAATLTAAAADSTAGPVTLVSVMAVNNEIGTIQPLAAVADLVRQLAPDAALHTDAVQALCWLDVASLAMGTDLISVSGHKFGGPKGIGALVVRDGTRLGARQLGGGQERDRRSGTPNVAGIVGLAAAARLVLGERAETVERVTKLRDRLSSGLAASVPGLVATTAAPDVVPGICHVCIDGIESESLLYLLERRDVFASAASSCSSGAMEPSHVLAAMGVPSELAQGSLRLSLGHASTDADVDAALDAVPAAVERLRRFSI